MVMFNGRRGGEEEGIVTLRCLENGPFGLFLCQNSHTHTHTLISSKILNHHTQTLPQQNTNRDGKAIGEPTCLQFSFGHRRFDTRLRASVRRRTIYISLLPLWLPSERRGLPVVTCGLLPAHFVALCQWVALLICSLDPAGFGLNEGPWKRQQNTDQSPSCRGRLCNSRGKGWLEKKKKMQKRLF